MIAKWYVSDVQYLTTLFFLQDRVSLHSPALSFKLPYRLSCHELADICLPMLPDCWNLKAYTMIIQQYLMILKTVCSKFFSSFIRLMNCQKCYKYI